MNLNPFGKNKKYEEIPQQLPMIEFLGEVEGEGLSVVRMELADALQDFNFVQNAYLSKLKYRDEEDVRIALIVDSSAPSNEVGPAVAQRCADIIPMDILFSDSIPEKLFQEIKGATTALYLSDMALFECPIVVGAGTNMDMPHDWVGAVVTYYACGTDYKDALMKVAGAITGEGYQFKEVFQGKVSQIDPDAWWDSIVLGKWPEYQDHFPTQEQLHLLVKVGGMFKGPMVGWEAQ